MIRARVPSGFLRLCVLLGAASCGGDRSGLSTEAYPEARARAECEKMRSCCAVFGAGYLADCIERATAEYEAYLDEYSVRLDEQAAAICVAAIEAASPACFDFESARAACADDLYRGELEVGDLCSLSVECVGSAACFDTGDGEARCHAGTVVDNGESCLATTEEYPTCASPLVCKAGRCSAECGSASCDGRSDGSACLSSEDCARGLWCEAGYCTAQSAPAEACRTSTAESWILWDCQGAAQVCTEGLCTDAPLDLACGL